MKFLLVEEKAKAYDEAIRKLRGMMPNWERLSYNGKTFLQDLIYIFPELAESEDEKIRKEIKQLIQGMHDADPRKTRWISWLEKQGEQKPIERVHEGMDLDEDKMTPFQREVFCIVDLDMEQEKGLSNICNKLLLLAEQEIQQKPKEWSEEDEKMQKAIHIYLDWLDGRKEVAPKGKYSIRDMIAWLLKQKPHNVPSSTELLTEWEEVEQRLKERRYEGPWQIAYDAFLEGFSRGAQVNSLKEVQEEPISESFQEWEKRYLEEHKDEIINVYDRHAGLIDGAIWQAFRTTKNAIEREVKVDAGGYPYIDATELYDYTEDKPLAKAGDKVKLIIIKGE